jgi:hypothetical protein
MPEPLAPNQMIQDDSVPSPVPTHPPHVQLSHIVQVSLQTLLKKLNCRQQLPRPRKEAYSVSVYDSDWDSVVSVRTAFAVTSPCHQHNQLGE